MTNDDRIAKMLHAADMIRAGTDKEAALTVLVENAMLTGYEKGRLAQETA